MKLEFTTSSIKDIELYRNYIQRFIDERCRTEDKTEVWSYMMQMPQIGSAIAKSYRMSNSERVSMILKNIFLPKLTVIGAGIKGAGKTAFMYYVAEQYHKITGHPVCVYNPLNYVKDILPKYFYDAYEKHEIKPKSLVIIDEAQIFYSSRRAMTKENVDMGSFLTIQRHTGCPIIVGQQILAMSDIDFMRMSDFFVFKMIGLLQMQKERTRKDPLFIFLDFLRPMNIEETLFISADLTQIYLARTPLPSFWSEELSTPARRLSLEEGILACKKFNERGMSPKRMAFRMSLLGFDWDETECMEYAETPMEKKSR